MKTEETKNHELLRLLHERASRKLNAYDMAILKCLWKAPDGGTLEELIDTLRSQQKDNYMEMNKIIGVKAAKLLEEIKP